MSSERPQTAATQRSSPERQTAPHTENNGGQKSRKTIRPVSPNKPQVSPLPPQLHTSPNAGRDVLDEHYEFVNRIVTRIHAQPEGRNLSPEDLAEKVAEELAGRTESNRKVDKPLIDAALGTLKRLGYVAQTIAQTSEETESTGGRHRLEPDLRARAAAEKYIRDHPLTTTPTQSREAEEATIVAHVIQGTMTVPEVADLYGMTPSQIRALVEQSRQAD